MTIKILAFFAMVCDHLVKAGIVESSLVLEIVGRVAFPLFVVSFAFGVHQASIAGRGLNWKRLMLLAIFAQVPFQFAFGLKHFASLNMLFVFLAGWAIWGLWVKYQFHGLIGVLTILFATWSPFGEFSYGGFGPLCVAFALGYFSYSGRTRWACMAIAASCWLFTVSHYVFPVLGAVASAITLAHCRWPGRRVGFGKFYVLHIYVIAMWKWLL